MTTAITPELFRQALGHFGTGVTVITTVGETGEPVGLTASSFNSVSLEPPLVLWSLARRAGSMAAFAACSHYAIHVLQAHQRPLAERFSRRSADRFADLPWRAGLGGAPVLQDVSVVFECKNLRQHEEGDHVVFVGEVKKLRSADHAQPLLYHGGRFYTELPMPEEKVAGIDPEPGSAAFVSGYLGYLLGQANHLVYRGFEADLREAGLTHIEWRVLAVLLDVHAMNLSELASAVLSKQPTVTKLTQRMVVSGWLTIEPDPADQRRVLLRSTKAGKHLARQLNERAKQREAIQLKRLSPKEQAELKRLLGKLQPKT